MIGGTIFIIALAILITLTRTRPTQPMIRTAPASSTAPSFVKEGELTFMSRDDRHIATIDVEIADSENRRMLGLMYRQDLEPLQGMLFIFPYEDLQSFWMKDTPLSLDMIFVNGAREIVTIHRNTTPLSQQNYASTRPTQFVVEVNAGFTDQYGIREGDKIRWRRMK